jgi:hypothetical protein
MIAYSLLGVVQAGIDHARRGLLGDAGVTARQRLVELGTTVMLGSFRTVAVAVLWYQAQALKDQRRWAELDGVYRWIAKVQPTDIDAHVFQVWNMAYNVQYDAATVVEGWRWIQRAVTFGQQGARRNRHHPRVWKLYWQIGWVYSHRCATVRSDRTTYFRDQVIERQGKSPLLVAADWYEKAFEAARREQDSSAAKVNVHYISMWAYVYEELARQREEAGDIAGCLQYREQSIALHRRIAQAFPEYAEHGEPKARELEDLIALYRQEQRADRPNQTGDDLEQEIRIRTQIAAEWSRLVEENPHFDEYGRNADRAADALEDLIGRVSDPTRHRELRDAVLATRYAAAHPQRQSDEAVARLEAAVALYDERIAAIGSLSQLARERRLVERIANAWGRILANPRPTAEQSQKALEAIRRADRLAFEALPKDQRPEAVSGVLDLWLTVLLHAQIDAPLGRRRIRDAARTLQDPLLQMTGNMTATLREAARRHEAGARAEVGMLLARVLSPQARQQHTTLLNRVEQFWLALLRRDPRFAAEAPVAEKNLATIADALAELGDAYRELLGRADNPHTRRARGLWRELRRFNPGNELYLKKLRRPDTKSRLETRSTGHHHH